MAVSAAQTDLESLLSLNNASTDPIRAVPTTIHLLQHFQSAVSSTLGCYDTSRVMQSSVGSIAWDHPYLMHIVLAFSCAHRRRFNIENCLFAEAMHWRDGLQLYRLKLAQLDRGQEEAPWDALVATTFLINMYAFSIDDQGDDLTDPLSDENLNTTFAPMEATGAFRGLFYFFREDKHSDSQWLPILTGTDDSSGKFTCHSPGIEGVQQNLADLCDMNASSTVDNNVYHKIVKSLAPLHTLQPSQENFAIFFAFLGRTWPHFKPLLYRKDPRGLLLFSYWLALLQQVDQWWLRTRTQRLLYTIVAFLWKTEDVQIHALLPSILTSTQ